MKKISRALRRHHHERMLRRALKKINHWYDHNQEWKLWYARRAANNMAICSCSMCRNERHNDWNCNLLKLTMQERKEIERFKYEMEEIDE